MFGIKCEVTGKTFRGQDFERLCCSRCSYWRREKIKVEDIDAHPAGGVHKVRVSINCPSLVLVETYRPKRNTHIDTTLLPKIGEPRTLIYEVADDDVVYLIRKGRYCVLEPTERL